MINLGDPGGPSNGHLVPQRDVIKRFLTLVTRDWETLEVPVELEIRLLKERQCQHRRFGVDDIYAATEWAAEQNEFGWNAHYVVNPVDASHVGAARADAIVASRYVFIDTDTPEALARIEASALTPSIEVTTGTVPHRRVHQHFAIAEGMIGIVVWAPLMAGAIQHFKSDPAAKDASRAMRLPGTINWPNKKKQERGYVPELTTFSATNATYTVADLRNTFGPVAADSVPRMAAFADRPAKTANDHPRRRDDEHGLVLDALSSIPGEDAYSEWVRIGMALHADVQGSPEGYRAFVAWSARSSKFDARECERKWREWDRKPADRLTAGTIIYLARQHGWQDPRQRKEVKSNGAAAQRAGAAIENAGKVKREPPRPLTRPVDPAAEFPVDALGPELAAATRAIEARTQAPLALCAQAVLGAVSLAAQGHRDVEMPGGLRRPLSEAFLAIGTSGERKTTVDAIALKPVRDVERDLQTQYELELASFKNELAAWEHARKPTGKGGKDKTGFIADLKAAGDEPTPPRKPIMLVSEPTPEGLVKLLAEGQPSVGLFSAEASTFIGGHGMSNESRLRTAGALSRLWDDGSADRVRGGDGAMKLYGRRLTTSLATQPGNGIEWLASPVLADQGLFSRLLIVAPASRIGTRFLTPEAEERVRQTQADLDRFHARIRELLEAVPKVAELDPPALSLSSEAHALWLDYSNAVEGAMGGGGSLAAIRAFANKAGEHALRLAGILTVYRDQKATKIDTEAKIDAEAVLNAIELVQHYLGEATRVNGMAAASEGSRRAQETLEFLQGLDHDFVHLAEIYQRGPFAVRNAAVARAVMQMLADHGYAEPIPEGAEIDGRHRREAWRVLPTDGEAGQ